MSDDFANVSWQSDEQKADQGHATSNRESSDDMGPGNTQRPRHDSVGPMGRNADPMDLAGVGDAVLHCEVTTPIKENDGTKDAYVSYLVTTTVSSLFLPLLRLC